MTRTDFKDSNHCTSTVSRTLICKAESSQLFFRVEKDCFYSLIILTRGADMCMFNNGTCTAAGIRLGSSCAVTGCILLMRALTYELKLSRKFGRDPACGCVRARLHCGNTRDKNAHYWELCRLVQKVSTTVVKYKPLGEFSSMWRRRMEGRCPLLRSDVAEVAAS